MRTIGSLVLCGLVLAGGVLVGRARPAPEGAPAEAKRLYQCPMHPQIVSDKPGVCPICQMRLQPVDQPGAAGPAPSAVPGHAGFTLSAERQQLIGVTSAIVERRPLEVEIRAAGKVAYDPALYQAIVEYREAVRSRGQPKVQGPDGGDALVRGALLKLRQQGIAEAQLAELVKGRDPLNLLLPDTAMWVYAQVYEDELPLVRAGQTMEISAPSLPGRTFRASVVAVDPIVDPKSRSARVRALVPTPEAALRPETYVSVRLLVPLGEQVAVPDGAVLDTGEHRFVFVLQDGGRFEPRAVELGRRARGWYEVLDGLAPGERVVTSANFLIDSESRFRAALGAFEGGGPHAGHAH